MANFFTVEDYLQLAAGNLQFDQRKSQRNKEKHGMDFVEAQALWEDPDRIEISAITINEPRFLVIGKIANACWSAIITYRGENIRIISVWRSRREEIEIYES